MSLVDGVSDFVTFLFFFVAVFAYIIIPGLGCDYLNMCSGLSAAVTTIVGASVTLSCGLVLYHFGTREPKVEE